MKIEHKEKIYGLRQEAREFPMMSVIGLSYICNSKCPSCPYTNSEIRSDYKDRPFMREETFKIIADQCGEYNVWLRVSGGGEPMLHPQAIELIEYAKQAGAKVGLITNGSRFSEEGSFRLVKAGVEMVEFSVDAGDPQTYGKVRIGLKWETLLDNVKRMVELRDRIGSQTKVIASAVNQKGVDIEGTEKFWGPIVDDFQKRKFLTWAINDPVKSGDPDPYLPPEERIPCPFIFERLNIDSKGKVMVCGFDIAGETNMGNVHEASLKEIWHSEDFNYYRKMHLERRGHEIAMCRDCPDWKYRSWKHNYWKIVNRAEKKRLKKLDKLHFQDIEGCITELEK